MNFYFISIQLRTKYKLNFFLLFDFIYWNFIFFILNFLIFILIWNEIVEYQI